MQQQNPKEKRHSTKFWENLVMTWSLQKGEQLIRT